MYVCVLKNEFGKIPGNFEEHSTHLLEVRATFAVNDGWKSPQKRLLLPIGGLWPFLKETLFQLLQIGWACVQFWPLIVSWTGTGSFPHGWMGPIEAAERGDSPSRCVSWGAEDSAAQQHFNSVTLQPARPPWSNSLLICSLIKASLAARWVQVGDPPLGGSRLVLLNSILMVLVFLVFCFVFVNFWCMAANFIGALLPPTVPECVGFFFRPF